MAVGSLQTTNEGTQPGPEYMQGRARAPAERRRMLDLNLLICEIGTRMDMWLS